MEVTAKYIRKVVLLGRSGKEIELTQVGPVWNGLIELVDGKGRKAIILDFDKTLFGLSFNDERWEPITIVKASPELLMELDEFST